MKKVLLVIVDALATRIVKPALDQGKLPNFRQLAERGKLHESCTSIFPSITPAATCSLVTGCYPYEHGISGAYWYESDRDEVAYYGDDIFPIIKQGIDRYLYDFQIKLNMDRLKVPTLFERIESDSRLRDAVINYLWYRGTISHEISVPPLLNWTLGGSLADSMQGPHLMFVGDFVSTPLQNGQKPSARGGMSRRYGFHDESTTDVLLEMAKQDSLSDFTLAYFPNNDFDSHENGPENALETVQAVDDTLGRLFDIQGGIDAFLDEYAILITGDHSQCDLSEEPAVDLNQILSKYKLAEAGKPWKAGEEMLVCPNMRAAQIYLRPRIWDRREEVITNLIDCDDVDQVMWCERDGGLGRARDVEFHVRTRNRGQISFQVGDPENADGWDDYQTPWSWRGNLSAVDADVETDGRIRYGDYPNALERIAGAFFEDSANLWVTAKVGREFCLPATSAHRGGSHGALHALDSTAPLIMAGLPSETSLAKTPRIVDIAPLCLQILGLKPPRAPGAGHVMANPS